MKKCILFFAIILYGSLSAQYSKDISRLNWKIWLDNKAGWWNDSLFLPPYNLSSIPTNPPGCGWKNLYTQPKSVTTQLPATVEQYFWNRNGSSYGVNGNYIGVSWFTVYTNIPTAWKGKKVSLVFESARMRTEIYINNQLAGYHLFDGLPFTVDISRFAKYGANNQIAVRVTDPNGNFAWQDYSGLKWGAYETVPSHGFGGITGKVFLEAKDNTYVDDIYIKNKPEKNIIDVEVTLHNSGKEKEGELVLKLTESGKQDILQTKRKSIKITGESILIKDRITFLNAKLWSPDNPNLYIITAEWKGKEKHSGN